MTSRCCSRAAEVTSDTPVKLRVIYGPPYGESPDKVIRPAPR